MHIHRDREQVGSFQERREGRYCLVGTELQSKYKSILELVSGDGLTL